MRLCEGVWTDKSHDFVVSSIVPLRMQVGIFYRKVLNEAERERLTSNIAEHVVGATGFIQERCVEMFSKCDKDYGGRIQKKLLKLKVHSPDLTMSHV